MEKLAFLWDRQKDRPLLHCSYCTGEIYAGERYYRMEEGPVCWGCLILYARQRYLELARLAGDEEAG